MSYIGTIATEDGFTPSAPAEGRDGGSWRRMVWVDEGRTGTIVAVWKAEPGVYTYPARPLDETFVVCEGEAIVSVGDGAPERIGPGSIVRIPDGLSVRLEVLTPFRKVATVVPRG